MRGENVENSDLMLDTNLVRSQKIYNVVVYG